jgi:hypothetical protein
VATPVGPASMLPRSPTWRSVSLGAPWFFYKQTNKSWRSYNQRCLLRVLASEKRSCRTRPRECYFAVRVLASENRSCRTRPRECYFAVRVRCKSYREERASLSKWHSPRHFTFTHTHTHRCASNTYDPNAVTHCVLVSPTWQQMLLFLPAKYALKK